MTKRVEVTITIGDRKVTLEGPDDFVRGEVERLTGTGLTVEPGVVHHGSEDAESGVGAGVGSLSERQLIAQKKPRNHVETVAVLAYCLTKNGQTEFSPEDVRRAYLRAHARPPKVVAQALRDAKNVADYVEPGKKRGTFRLSPHGERTVMFDMPKSESDHE